MVKFSPFTFYCALFTLIISIDNLHTEDRKVGLLKYEPNSYKVVTGNHYGVKLGIE